LDGWVSVLSNVFRIIEAEEALDLVESSSFLNSKSVGIQVVDVLNI